MNQASILALLRQLKPMRSARFPKIRIGQNCDGGYVINQAIADISCVISLGIGVEASFDSYFHHRQVPVVQVDGIISAPPFAYAYSPERSR